MAMRPSDTGISLLAGGTLFAIIGVSLLGKSWVFLLGGVLVLLVLISSLTRN